MLTSHFEGAFDASSRVIDVMLHVRSHVLAGLVVMLVVFCVTVVAMLGALIVVPRSEWQEFAQLCRQTFMQDYADLKATLFGPRDGRR